VSGRGPVRSEIAWDESWMAADRHGAEVAEVQSRDGVGKQTIKNTKAGKPFFLWHNTTRMHVCTRLSHATPGTEGTKLMQTLLRPGRSWWQASP
jgi:hypothetical protein